MTVLDSGNGGSGFLSPVVKARPDQLYNPKCYAWNTVRFRVQTTALIELFLEYIFFFSRTPKGELCLKSPLNLVRKRLFLSAVFRCKEKMRPAKSWRVFFFGEKMRVWNLEVTQEISYPRGLLYWSYLQIHFHVCRQYLSPVNRSYSVLEHIHMQRCVSLFRVCVEEDFLGKVL